MAPYTEELEDRMIDLELEIFPNVEFHTFDESHRFPNMVYAEGDGFVNGEFVTVVLYMNKHTYEWDYIIEKFAE